MNNYKLVKNTEWKEVEINGENKEIPIDWSVDNFKNLFLLTSSRRVHADKYVPKGIPFFRGTEITNLKKGIKNFDTFISEEYFNDIKMKYELPKVGDILITAVGTIGSVFLLEKEFDFYFKDGNIIWLKNKNNEDKKYIEFFLNSEYTKSNIFGLGAGSAYGALTIKNLGDSECILPPISQQSSIASILSAQESIIQDIESLISKYESRFQYLSDELLSGRLRVKEVDGEMVIYKNPDDNWKEVEINGEMKEIPSDWEVDKLKKHILVINGYAFPKSTMLNERTQTSVTIIKIGNIDNDIIIENSGTGQNYYDGVIKESFVPKYNDLIIGLSGANAGKTGIYKLKNKTVLNQRNAIVRIKSDNITQDFFNYFWFKDALEVLRETTKDSAIPNISLDDIESIDVFIFSKIEQLSISQILTDQKNLIDVQKQILQQEKQKFDWLLDNLLSGKYLIKEN